MRTVRIAVAAARALRGRRLQDPTTQLFEEVPPAEQLWPRATRSLEGTSFLGVYTTSTTKSAIEKFQDIIDNYPYSDYAVRSELAIADAYFENEKYEEALSYYRDFAELHPQHAQVPYTLYRAALCHERRRRARAATRPPRATRSSSSTGCSASTRTRATEAEVLWRELRTRLATHVRDRRLLLRARRVRGGAERYRALLNEYPGLGLDPRALYKLGVCYAALNRVDEADQIFRMLVDNYKDTEFATRRAESSRRTCRDRRDAARARRARPFSDAERRCYEIGRRRFERGDREGALRALERLLETRRASPTSTTWSASCTSRATTSTRPRRACARRCG